MVKTYYFDSSAIIKKYFKETGSEVVDRLLGGGSTLSTATLTYAETYSIFYRLRREGRLSLDMIQDLRNVFEKDWQELNLIELDAEILNKIPDILSRFPLRASDGIHLASAASLAENRIDVELVASDTRLLNAARDFGLKTIDPTR